MSSTSCEETDDGDALVSVPPSNYLSLLLIVATNLSRIADVASQELIQKCMDRVDKYTVRVEKYEDELVDTNISYERQLIIAQRLTNAKSDLVNAQSN